MLTEVIRPATRLGHEARVAWLRIYANLVTTMQWTDDAADLLDCAAEYCAAHVDLSLRGDRLAAGAATMARFDLAVLGYRMHAQSAPTGLDQAIAELVRD